MLLNYVSGYILSSKLFFFLWIRIWSPLNELSNLNLLPYTWKPCFSHLNILVTLSRYSRNYSQIFPLTSLLLFYHRYQFLVSSWLKILLGTTWIQAGTSGMNGHTRAVRSRPPSTVWTLYKKDSMAISIDFWAQLFKRRSAITQG